MPIIANSGVKSWEFWKAKFLHNVKIVSKMTYNAITYCIARVTFFGFFRCVRADTLYYSSHTLHTVTCPMFIVYRHYRG